MTTAASILTRAHTQLNDDSGDRWPATELIAYLNEGQRELVRQRPDALNDISTVTGTAGWRQSLPVNAMALMDVICNTSGSQTAISKVDQQHLDAVSPGWRSMTPSHTVKHFMADAREPRMFLVYPPATEAASMEVLHSLVPTELTASGALATSAEGDLDVDDWWADCLLNYVLYRAYSKDAEFGGNAQLAASFLALFTTALGGAAQQAAAAT